MASLASAIKAARASGMPMPEGVDMSKMGKQAEQIWKMLDDMADNDPKAYAKFIAAQTDADRRSREPHIVPHAGFSFSTTRKDLGAEGAPMIVNVCAHRAIQPPLDNTNRPVADADGKDAGHVSPATMSGLQMPLVLTEPRQLEQSDGSIADVVDAIFNPWVAAKCNEDMYSGFKLQVVELALQWVENEYDTRLSRSYKIVEDAPYVDGYDGIEGELECRPYFPSKDDLERSEAGDGPPTAKSGKLKGKVAGDQRETKAGISLTPQGDAAAKSLAPDLKSMSSPSSLLSELHGGDEESKAEPSISLPKPRGDVSREGATEAPRAPVIEEMMTKPDFTIETKAEGQIAVVIQLPDVKSMAGVGLDIDKHELSLIVPGKYELSVEFPTPVNDGAARAKFSKKRHALTVVVDVLKLVTDVD